MDIKIEIYNAKNSKPYGKCHVTEDMTVSDLKIAIHQQLPQTPKAERLSVRLEAKGKQVKDTETLKALGVHNGGKLFVKDLGPQIGWKTVFLAEYAGPLIVYLWVYTRPYVFYGALENAKPLGLTAHIAAACYTFHYSKRLLETIFVHRFSHATMPLGNLFKNCSYYWGFTAYVSYHINHPLYTSPCMWTVFAGLAGFLFCELGNFSIHMTLRNLRPAGSKVRKIPVPDANPLSKLFNLVSCPNYTYEIGAWLCFSLMTKCFPSLLFTAAGAYQMTMWALGKHRNYRKEFKDYPRRKAIFPFLI